MFQLLFIIGLSPWHNLKGGGQKNLSINRNLAHFSETLILAGPPNSSLIESFFWTGPLRNPPFQLTLPNLHPFLTLKLMRCQKQPIKVLYPSFVIII